MLAGQDGLETFLHQLLPGPGNRVDAGIQGGGDLAVTPSFAGLGSIGFPRDVTCARSLSRADPSLSGPNSMSITTEDISPA
jgi:hypothetical protein